MLSFLSLFLKNYYFIIMAFVLSEKEKVLISIVQWNDWVPFIAFTESNLYVGISFYLFIILIEKGLAR